MLSNALFLIRSLKTYATLVALSDPNFLQFYYTDILDTVQKPNNCNDYTNISKY